MTKEFLEECLAKGMSLEAIGKRVGKHESTVGHWLKKHGLGAAQAEKHAAKGAPSKEEMERLLGAGLSLREIAHRLDRSLATVRHWMRKYEMETDRSSRLRELKDASREGAEKVHLNVPSTACRPSLRELMAGFGVVSAAPGQSLSGGDR